MISKLAILYFMTLPVSVMSFFHSDNLDYIPPVVCKFSSDHLKVEVDQEETVAFKCTNYLFHDGFKNVQLKLHTKDSSSNPRKSIHFCKTNFYDFDDGEDNEERSNGYGRCFVWDADLHFIMDTQIFIGRNISLKSGHVGISCLTVTASLDLEENTNERHLRLEDLRRIPSKLLTSNTELAIFTHQDRPRLINVSDEDEATIIRIISIYALCVANLLLGSALNVDWENIKIRAQAIIKLKQRRILKRHLLKFSAWKVGIVTTIFPQPFLAFIIGRLFFTGGCRAATDLSRFGLLILGVSPSSGLSSYLVTLYHGNIELSITILVLSTVLSPLTITAFWNLFDHHLFETDDSSHLRPQSPTIEVLEILAILLIPVCVGVLIAAKFPTIKKLLDAVRKPLMVIGLVGASVVYYFQYQHFIYIFTVKHLLACLCFILGSVIISLSLCGCFWKNLETSEIISIVIDASMRNGTVCYAIIIAALPSNPEGSYATAFSNAQILFTGAPLLVGYILMILFKMIFKMVSSLLKRNAPVVDTEIEYDESGGYKMVKISKLNRAWTEEDQSKLNYLWI